MLGGELVEVIGGQFGRLGITCVGADRSPHISPRHGGVNAIYFLMLLLSAASLNDGRGEYKHDWGPFALVFTFYRSPPSITFLQLNHSLLDNICYLHNHYPHYDHE